VLGRRDGVSNVLFSRRRGRPGNQPGAKAVFDFDCIVLLIPSGHGGAVQVLSGRRIRRRPRVFLGAAEILHPRMSCVPIGRQEGRGRRRFIHDQLIFDIELVQSAFMRVCDRAERTRLQSCSVGPLPSPQSVRWLRTNVPNTHSRRFIAASRRPPPADEGKKICIELIQQIRDIQGVAACM